MNTEISLLALMLAPFLSTVCIYLFIQAINTFGWFSIN